MKTVAVIGASADPTKYGNKAVRAYKQQCYQVFQVILCTLFWDSLTKPNHDPDSRAQPTNPPDAEEWNSARGGCTEIQIITEQDLLG